MVEIRRSELPGVGLRYEFNTSRGKLVGVIAHRTGHYEVFVCAADDPDRPQQLLDLDEDDRHALIEVLGGLRVVEQLDRLQQEVEGLAIDWIQLTSNSSYAGRPLGDTAARTRTGTSIVAVLREGKATPAPGPDEVLEAEDILVVVGTADGIRQLSELLRSG